MSEPDQRTVTAEDREDAVVAHAHVHVTPELLDDPVAFANYVICELRYGGTILLSIIREDQP